MKAVSVFIAATLCCSIMALSQTVIQAEDAFVFGGNISQQYAGYTGSGYVDITDKTGAYMEFGFRRATAASDTIRVFYANGASSRNFAITVNDVASGTITLPSTGSWTTWSSQPVVVALQAGLNRLRFTTTTNSTYPNVDRIAVGGQPAVEMFKLVLTKSGNGSVSANPLSTYYDAGNSVELSAVPSGNSFFSRWMGGNDSPANPYNLLMNSNKTVAGVFLDTAGTSGFTYEPGPIGFASMDALGYNGTTGGEGGYTVTVTDADDLWNLMLLRSDASRTLNLPPLTVYVVGVLSPGAAFGSNKMLDVKDAYNISIIGVGNDATITGFGLLIVRSINIIVRNIKFASCPDDGVAVQADDAESTGHHVWIDHCSFTDTPPPGYPPASSYDGALDITHTASYVTVSWCHFMNHSKTCLMGHSDNNTEDVAMKITYHHDWFDATVQRHPRVRYGKAHVYNNYYLNNSLYGISSNLEADVLVEGCYFHNVPLPTDTSRDGSPPGDVLERNNIFVGSGTPQTRGTAFEASSYYQYTLDDASTVPGKLSSYSGSGRYDFSYNGNAATYTLTVNVTNGTVTRVPDLPAYTHGTNVELTATPAPGYYFVNWTGDVPPSQSSNNPLTVTMDANKTLTANFTNQVFTLTITATNGTVTRVPDLAQYPQGTSVQLTANPSTGYFFVDWSGDVPVGHESDNPLVLLMDGNKNLSAHFSSQTFTLTTGATHGSITRNPNQAAYDSGAVVQLTAVPDTGYHFVSWSGDAGGTSNPTSIVMNSNKSVTANFSINQYTLTITSANGTVVRDPDQPVYDHGTTVILTATPNTGYIFIGWTGDVTGMLNPVSLYMNSNKAVTANYTSTGSIVQSNGTGGGDWSLPATWQGGSVPTGSQNVVIVAGDSVFSAAASTCNNLTVNGGGKLLVTVAPTVSGLFTLDAGSFYYHGASGTFTLPGATRFLDDASTVVYNYTGGSTSIAGGTFGNLVIAKASNTNASGVLTINGDLTLSMSSGSSGLRGTSGSTSRTNFVHGNVYITGGTLSCIDAGTGGAIGAWNIDGNVVVSGSTNSRLSPFSSGGAAGVAGVYNIGGDLVVAGGRLQYASNSSTLGLGIINVGGNLGVQSGSAITDNGSTGPFALNFTGSSPQTVTLGMNFTMATNISDTVRTGATVVFNLGSYTWGSSAGTQGSFVVDGLLEMKDSSRITGPGSFVVEPGATLRIGSPDGIAAISSNGNIRVTGARTFSPEATYEYTGTSAQHTGDGLPASVEYLKINNAAGAVLSGSVTVNGTLIVETGHLDLNGNTITLGGSAVLSETLGNTVTGTSGTITTTRSLHSPDPAIDIAGMGIRIGSSADLGSTVITRGHAVQTAGDSSVKRYFDIAPTINSGLNATLVFSYDDSELNGNTETNLTLFKSTDAGTNWIQQGGAVNTTANTISLSGIDAFSRWTAAAANTTVSVGVPVASGWNMISNPILTSSDSVRQLFPDASFSYAFAFLPGSGYQQRSILENGIGYWEKFPRDTISSVTGIAIDTDTLGVGPGWNLFGSIAFPVDTSAIVTIPPGLRSSLCYGYSGGYVAVPTIEPGKAYWVKTSASGSLVLAFTGSARPKSRHVVSSLDQFNTITITDATGAHQTLYFGNDDRGTFPVSMYEMPPLGPEGAFDARFESQRMLEVYDSSKASSYSIPIRSAVYPLKVSWNVRESERVFMLNDGVSSGKAMIGTGQATISNPGTDRLVIETQSPRVPVEFLLEQNYPNPFNATTEIRFTVDYPAIASLEVFNVLGERVVTLFHDVAEVGKYHAVRLDASNLASGIYFYRLHSGPKKVVKKLLLLK